MAYILEPREMTFGKQERCVMCSRWYRMVVLAEGFVCVSCWLATQDAITVYEADVDASSMGE